jgi:hypothetical protein
VFALFSILGLSEIPVRWSASFIFNDVSHAKGSMELTGIEGRCGGAMCCIGFTLSGRYVGDLVDPSTGCRILMRGLDLVSLKSQVAHCLLQEVNMISILIWLASYVHGEQIRVWKAPSLANLRLCDITLSSPSQVDQTSIRTD